jgi:hypothetical protein
MKPLQFLIIGTTALICFTGPATAEPKKKQAAIRSAQVPRLTAAQKRLLEKRKMLVEKTRASRDELQALLEGYEEKLVSESADYAMTEIMYGLDLVSQSKLDQSKRELANTRLAIQQAQQWIAEDDVALSLAEDGFSNLPLGRYQQRIALIRYNGFADWSLADAEKIAKFFLEHFDRALPVSAMGQSPTHDRMGLDHRDAMDVAVRPDSQEGRALMAYLRQAGIPFIAFRNKMRGWATGAHIHIGTPSLRLEQVKRSPASSVSVQKSAGQG